MSINPGMLLFALLDAGIAFFLVYTLTKAKFGGNKKTIARTLGTLLGLLAFTAEFCAIIRFQLAPDTLSAAGRYVVYAAPPVLSILIGVLVLLSQPPKEKGTDNEDEDELSSDPENDDA